MKLTCLENGRYIIFKAGENFVLNEPIMIHYKDGESSKFVSNEANESWLRADFIDGILYHTSDTWYDEFCYKYIQEKKSYAILIKEIIEVK